MSAFEHDTIEVDSWSEAQEALFLGSWQNGLNRFRPSFAFRGLNQKYDTLPTSLIRLDRRPSSDGFDPEHGKNVEKDILRNFVKYAEDQTLSDRSVWHQLSVAQHYGLPTRILDWTYSPLVALHFATADLRKLDKDGIVWVVDIDQVHEELPSSMREELSGHVYTVAELTEIADELDKFDTCFADANAEERPIFFEPPSLDGRIVNQFGLFSIFPDPTKFLDEWLATQPHLYKKVVIPADVKMEIRDKLDASNITERVLFPGLGGLADWLTRYYSPIEDRETRNPNQSTPAGGVDWLSD